MIRIAWLAPWITLVALVVPASLRANDEKSLDELILRLKSKDAEERVEAAEAIGRLETKAKSAIPALLELNKDKEFTVRLAAIDAIYEIAIPLKGKGPEVKKAVTVLAEGLRDKKLADNENFEALTRTMDVLSLIAEQEPSYGKPVAAAIMPFLKHEVDIVRHFAISSLENLKDAAKPAVPTLIQMAKGDDEADREKALQALSVIDPEAAKKAGLKLP
jgi:HEAT repeat protein